MSLPFADRRDAAQRLAHALLGYRSDAPLVLAIPRGASRSDWSAPPGPGQSRAEAR